MTTIGTIVDRCGAGEPREATMARGMGLAAELLREIADFAERALGDWETASTLAGKRMRLALKIRPGSLVQLPAADLSAAGRLARSIAAAWERSGPRGADAADPALVLSGETVLSGLVAAAIRRIPERCVHGVFDPAVSSCDCILQQVSLHGVIAMLEEMRLRAVAATTDEWRTE